MRAFNALNFAGLVEFSKRSERVGVPIAGDDNQALEIAATLIRGVGFEPVVVGSQAFGRHLLPGEPLGGAHSAAELRKIAATLK